MRILGGTMLISPHVQQWALSSIKKVAQKIEGFNSEKRRRFLLIHLDGVPYPVLEGAIATGRMPFLSRLVRSGRYAMDSAFWGTPASTPCFQAGLLYGIRHPNFPAYEWFDRELGRRVKMSVPVDTRIMEERLHAQQSGGLLEDGGMAYLSLFRGRANNSLCMSALTNPSEVLGCVTAGCAGLADAARWGLGAYLCDAFKSMGVNALEVARWANQVNDWRFEPGFFFNRMFLSSLGWKFSVRRAIVDMVSGAPSIYLVYGSYDEVSHRRGPFSEQAREELYRVDAQLEELYAVAKAVENPYDVYFITDHGHVESTPFEQRAGASLTTLLQAGGEPPLSLDVCRGLLDGRAIPGAPAWPEAPSAPIVVEAGNFSHIYLEPRQAALEASEVVARHPAVLSRILSQPDVGLVALRRGTGAVAIIGGGVYGPREVANAPLAAEFSRQAVVDLLEELPAMPTAGDLVLYGQSVSKRGTVGFAWEFGSHGGLTTMETNSVMCWPSESPVDLSGLHHCVELHQKLSEVYRN
jgi:hypothetical protein